MALNANEGRTYEPYPVPVYTDLPLDASAKVYEGSYLGENASTGLARALVSGDAFMGIAAAGADNTGGAAGDVVVRARQKGLVKLTVATVAGPADYAATVNATDDGTTTLAAGSAIGKVARHVSGTTAMVNFEAAALASL
jgi:hypothetical protein